MFHPDRAKIAAQAAQAKPIPSPVANDSAPTFEVGAHIGGFCGYLRRPKSSSAGLLAMVFGENGHDADIITVFHLSHYQDLPAKISIWMIKDKDGRSMRVNGKFPLLTEFVGIIRRPAASNAGQVAQFFGRNGPNADAVNVLNRSDLLDAFVYVEVQKAEVETQEARDIKTEDPSTEIAEEAERLVPAEEKALKKQQARAKEAMRILSFQGFFREPAVLQSLGTDDDYRAWLVTQPCCHPGDRPCDQRPIRVLTLPNVAPRKYYSVGMCEAHAKAWESGEIHPGVVQPLSFLQSRVNAMVQLWAQDALRKALGVPDGFEVPPIKLHQWAIDHRVSVPPAFLSFCEPT